MICQGQGTTPLCGVDQLPGLIWMIQLALGPDREPFGHLQTSVAGGGANTGQILQSRLYSLQPPVFVLLS